MPGPAFTSRGGEPLELVLFKRDTCFWSWRVRAGARRLGLALPMRDTRKDTEAAAELVRLGGKAQVPCLVANGQALYDSKAILRYLEREVVAAAPALPEALDDEEAASAVSGSSCDIPGAGVPEE